MDTFEARHRMRELARQALVLVDGFTPLEGPTPDSAAELRRLAVEGRTLLSDAGFPAESAWRALERAANALIPREPDPGGERWVEVADDLRIAVEILDSLLGTAQREADFRIVG